MKRTRSMLLGGAVCLLLASTSFAGVVLIEEDFEGTAGADISTLGWSSAAGSSLISSHVMDDGMSAATNTPGDWSQYTQAVNYTLAAGEYFQLTMATEVYWVAGGDTTGNRAGFILSGAGGLAADSYRCYVTGQYDEVNAFYYNRAITDAGTLPLTGSIQEIRLIGDASGVTISRRLPGLDWETVTSTSHGITQATGLMLIWEWDSGPTPSYIDSVKLEVIPEPSTLVLLVSGLALGVYRRKKQ